MNFKNSYNHASQAELVKTGDNFFEKVLKIIHNSKHVIHLQTYILADDETGMEVINALTKAVKRGVSVYLLVDAFGSHELKYSTIKTIKESGINFRTYSPLFTRAHIHFGRRLHHKILVSDEKEAIIGGINIDNNYHLKGKETPWLDFAVYVNGNICEEITNECKRLWYGKLFRRKHLPKTPKEAFAKTSLLEKSVSASTQSPFWGLGLTNQIFVKLRQNDWLYGKKGISLGLNNSIRHAHSDVIIMASYFLPGGKIRKSLKNASKRKVSVKIILPGISDVKLVKYATKYWYAWMLRYNLELYEWDETILHGKIMKVDKDWVSIGSYNINHLSHFSSIETNLEVKDETFCRKVDKELQNVMASCIKIETSEYIERMNSFEKFTCWLSFQTVRFLFRLQFAVLSKD